MDREKLAEELEKLETWELLDLLKKELERRRQEDLLGYWDSTDRLSEETFEALCVLKILSD